MGVGTGVGTGVGIGVGDGLGDGVGPSDRTRSTWLPTPTGTPELGFVLITSPANLERAFAGSSGTRIVADSALASVSPQGS